MRIFRNKSFTRFAKKAGLDDATLRKAVDDAERGLIDAQLAAGVIKQRVARPGKGKSGGFRTIILYRAHALAFFVHGFAKKDQDNIEVDELAALKLLASQMLSYDDQAIAKAVESGTLIEVTRHEKDKTVS
ncbi:MAG: type II toxin-antitoxin system RelE/ParE family toxin [Candidatus Binatus sp.]|uniref:type II toxin-antitoxin system RelE/ParE family toxin n=1 Tax=Candidatus Binatus sp. TaxID=2811406 RepID=UPI003C75C644